MAPRLAVLLALVGLAAPARAREYPYLAAGDATVAGTCQTVPPGWERPEFDEALWPKAPIVDAGVSALADAGVSDAGAHPDAGPPPCDAFRERRRFDVGLELGRLTHLVLRVRYHDGFVIWLNGVEVARRRIPPDAVWATETHGPESESLTVPITPGLLRPTGNLLAVEARPSRAGRHGWADVALAGEDGARIIRGPYLQRLSTSEGWLLVDTDLPTTVELRWGPRHGGILRGTSDGAATHHALHLTNLQPGAAYHYELSARDTGGGEAPEQVEADFHTPPSAGHPLRFIVYGDVRSGHDIHAQVVQAITGEAPDVVLLTGDLVDAGTDDGDWERFFDIEAPLLRQIVSFVAPGNHEYQRKRSGLARFLQFFLRPTDKAWWSVDVAGVHFALLDSEAFADPAQLAWLDQDLAEARRKKARALFVVGHDGPFSSAMHGDNHVAVRDYVPLFEKYRVAMVFSGHDHDYERLHVGNIDYVVTGGGGAELRTPRCGVPGKKKCGKRTLAFANEHNYVSVEVWKDRFRVCPKRPDGTLLEACPTFSLKR